MTPKTPRLAAGGLADLKLDHYSKDGTEAIPIQGAIDICTAPRPRELLIDPPGTNTCHLIVNLDKAGFPAPPARGCWPAA